MSVSSPLFPMSTDLVGPSAIANCANLLVLGSYEYVNFDAVHHWLSLIPSQKLTLISKFGIGHIVLKSATCPTEIIKWWGTKKPPDLLINRALVFWDGHDQHILSCLTHLHTLNIPLTIIGSDANPVDPAQLTHATLTHKDIMTPPDTESTATLPTEPSVQSGRAPARRPQMIVDAPVDANAHKSARVRLYIELPRDTFDAYSDQASLTDHKSIEKVLSDRLRSTVDYTSGRALYFNDAQRADLERITGGHMFKSPEEAINRLQTMVAIKINDVTIEVSGNLLMRASSRAKSMRQTLEQYLKREVLSGLRKATGLDPY